MLKKQQSLQTKLAKFIQSLPSKDKDYILTTLTQLQKQSQSPSSQSLPYPLFQSLPLGKIELYRQLKAKLRKNEDTIKVIISGKAISQLMDAFTQSKERSVEEDHQCFSKILTALNQFQSTALELQLAIDYATLREQLYMQMIGKLNRDIQGSDASTEIFQKIFKQYSLPLKKDESRKEGINPEHRDFFAYQLYRESCLSTLKRYLLSLLEKEDKGSDQSLLSIYWQPVGKAVSYLFISHAQLRNPEEPGWMFEYLQQVLNDNYKYFLQFLCRKDVKQQINTTISRHFLAATFNTLFTQLICKRFEEDLSGFNEFLIFNYIDQLGKFQDKLYSSFSLRPNLVQTLLLRFDGPHQILNKALDYEQKWFQSKIFDQFINIDYSKVSLKNLDAFNIVGSFLSLFQRLNQKYANLQNTGLRGKINLFYQKQVMNLVAHVKTSFDRIYHHSKLQKIDVLLGFKRVEKELRTGLTDFLNDRPELEEALQREYYSFLEQYFQVCALEAVTPTHKKLHISLGDIMNYLCSEEEHDHQKYLTAFGKIFDQWEVKMEMILKFASYSDGKVRAIFFKYLQATNFSSVGLNLYLKIFQPYLRVLFAEERHRALISMITMGRKAFNDYVESHSTSLNFLSPQEKKQLQAFKRTVNIE